MYFCIKLCILDLVLRWIPGRGNTGSKCLHYFMAFDMDWYLFVEVYQCINPPTIDDSAYFIAQANTLCLKSVFLFMKKSNRF